MRFNNKPMLGLLIAAALTGLCLSMAAKAQAVKPRISPLPEYSRPRGCSYSIDDWRGSMLLWAPYQYADNNQENNLLIVIDDQIRSIPINSRGNNYIAAYDGTYYVDVRADRWNRVGSELRQSRAILMVRNTRSYAETSIVARASEGC